MISVIIPCKNEPYLQRLIGVINTYLSLPHEIHVQREAGLSNAILCGVKRSTGDIVVILDADGSHNPKYIPNMIKMLNFYDIVIGSRYIKNGRTQDYFVRYLISRLFCKVAKALLNLDVNDNMSGFIVTKRNVFEQLKLKPFGYKFALEMMVKSKGKFKVGEFPVVFEKRKIGYSKTGLLQGIRTLAFIYKLWLWSD